MVEVAVLLPLMLLLLMAVVQLGLWFHVRAVMTTAANKGLDATRVDGGTADDGQRATEEFLAKTEALDGVSIDVDRGADSASVEISGDVISLLFGLPLHVSVAVEAPVEQVTMTLRRSDRGSVSVELVVLTPAFALMIALVLLVGRTQASRAEVDAAAHAAARSITLSRDPVAVAEIAHEAPAERLDVGSPSCLSLGWDVDITPEQATVVVTCDVDLSEAVLLPVPGVVSVSATSSEVFDRFREDSDSGNLRVEGA